MEGISTEYLKKVLKFDDSDLKANRAGKRSSRQWSSVRARSGSRQDALGIFFLGAAFLAVLVCSLGAALQQGIISSKHDATNVCLNLEGDETCLGYYGTIALVGIGVIIALFFTVGGLIGIVQTIAVKLGQANHSRVEKEEGYATLGEGGDRVDRYYYIEVGKKQIMVSEQDYQALHESPAVSVRVYYASDSRQLLSAEVVEA
jgi:hypothetical protein